MKKIENVLFFSFVLFFIGCSDHPSIQSQSQRIKIPPRTVITKVSQPSTSKEIKENAYDKIKHIYFVKKNDNLSKISRKFNIKIAKILKNNPGIINPDLIYPGQKIILDQDIEIYNYRVKKTQSPQNITINNLKNAEKIKIIKKIALQNDIPWQVLAGLSQQESSFGKFLSGDSGKSIGPFQIHLPSHPEVSFSKAMNFEWSANWSAKYLKKLGAKKDLFRALQLWNGSTKNPKTLIHAKKVMQHINNFGLKV